MGVKYSKQLSEQLFEKTDPNTYKIIPTNLTEENSSFLKRAYGGVKNCLSYLKKNPGKTAVLAGMAGASAIGDIIYGKVLSNPEVYSYFRKHFPLLPDWAFNPDIRDGNQHFVNAALNGQSIGLYLTAALNVATLLYAGWLYKNSRKSE